MKGYCRIMFLLFSLGFRVDFQAQTTEEKKLFLYYYDLAVNYQMSNIDSSLKYVLKTLEITEKLPNHKFKIDAYTLAGNTYNKLYEFDTALSYFLKALKLATEQNDKKESAILGNIGRIYMRQERFEEGYKYCRKGYEAALIDQNYEVQVVALINMPDYFNSRNMPDSSIEKLNLALSIARIHQKNRIALVYDNIANSYFNKAELSGDKFHYKTVLAYVDSALVLHLARQDSVSIAYDYGLLGAAHMKLGSFAASEKYYILFQELNKRLNDIFGLKLGYEEMGELYASQGSFEKAYSSRLKYDSINKLYLNELSNKQVQELDKKYQTEKKEQENQLLSARNNLSEEVIKRQKTTVILVVVGLFALLIALVFIFKNLRTQKKANAIIQAQKEEVESQKNIVVEKNKEITDSIRYAKRIQQALIPSEKFFEKEMNKTRS